jgi:hypothetical protein
MPSRRREDRIRDLCAKVSAASESELAGAIAELKSALREHSLHTENLARRDLINLRSQTDESNRAAQSQNGASGEKFCTL